MFISCYFLLCSWKSERWRFTLNNCKVQNSFNSQMTHTFYILNCDLQLLSDAISQCEVQQVVTTEHHNSASVPCWSSVRCFSVFSLEVITTNCTWKLVFKDSALEGLYAACEVGYLWVAACSLGRVPVAASLAPNAFQRGWKSSNYIKANKSEWGSPWFSCSPPPPLG